MFCIRYLIMLNLFNSTITEAHTFPKLPELTAEKRARLFSYLTMVHQSFVTYTKFHPEDEYTCATWTLYATMVSILLDGSSTVKEFLDRDTERKYEIVGKDIIVEEDGVRSFICPCCDKQISFPAVDERYMEKIRESGGVALACPNCSHQRKSAKQAVMDMVFGGGEADEQ